MVILIYIGAVHYKVKMIIFHKPYGCVISIKLILTYIELKLYNKREGKITIKEYKISDSKTYYFKRWLVSGLLKSDREATLVTSWGNVFHVLDPVTLKLLAPVSVRVFGTYKQFRCRVELFVTS